MIHSSRDAWNAHKTVIVPRDNIVTIWDNVKVIVPATMIVTMEILVLWIAVQQSTDDVVPSNIKPR